MKKKSHLFKLFIIFFFIGILVYTCQPIREFHKVAEYNTNSAVISLPKPIVEGLPVVVILASNSGTEVFDLLTPYHLFSSTNQLNVIIAAPKKQPFLLWKGVFAMPHYSINEIENLNPDLIVVPAYNNPLDSVICSYLNLKSYNKILSVCEGSRTLAYAGLLDNMISTSHTSSISDQQKEFPKVKWERGLKYTEHHNIYTTAGVANAVEGSLHLIEVLLGKEEKEKVMAQINYPSKEVSQFKKQQSFGFKSQLEVISKIWFKKNRRIGVLLNEGIDEMKLAMVLDCYNRTFPKKIESFTIDTPMVLSKYGLQLIPSTSSTINYDEIHIFDSTLYKSLQGVETIDYSYSNSYLFPYILSRIEKQNSSAFRLIVEQLLDYHPK